MPELQKLRTIDNPFQQAHNPNRRIKSENKAFASEVSAPAFPEIFEDFYVFRGDFYFGGPEPPFSF
jgi:hypothetical protein